jgi:hypothetical protein
MNLGLLLRDLKELLCYPLWELKGRPSPDNHIYKKRRVYDVALKNGCTAFIETGTFFGQMVNYAKSRFDKVISIEIYEPLYYLNKIQFDKYSNVEIIHGGSEDSLDRAIKNTDGRILFWLDGHYSGEGTGLGENITPIFSELNAISFAKRNDHCILIDDARLFSGLQGYPELDAVIVAIKKINPDYFIRLDHDCILATP